MVKKSFCCSSHAALINLFSSGFNIFLYFSVNQKGRNYHNLTLTLYNIVEKTKHLCCLTESSAIM